MTKPATPPTIPPTRTGVGGDPLPPDPAPELDVDEGAEPVLLGPPAPPTLAPVLEEMLELLDTGGTEGV